MSLLCSLGRHQPRGIPRWNDGLYFATCERCGCDLVRTAFQGWHVPRGYKVVWSDRPPASRPEVALVREERGAELPSNDPTAPARLANQSDSAPTGASSPPEAAEAPMDPPPAPSPSTDPPRAESEPSAGPAAPGDAAPGRTSVPAGGSGNGRLPIQDVLAHLNAEESANRALETPPAQAETPAPQPPPAPAEPPARQRRSTWDFMDDDPFEHRAPGPERAPGQGAAPAEEGIPLVDPKVEPASRKAGGAPEQWRRLKSAVSNFFSGPSEPRPLLVTGLALAVAVAVALALYSAGYPVPGSGPDSPEAAALPGGGPEGAGAAAEPDPFAASSPYVSPETGTAGPQQRVSGDAREEVAYVAASLLICRDAPADGALRVRNLLRGKEVRVLGYDGAWASLAYRGGQCWAQAQYLSPVPPL